MTASLEGTFTADRQEEFFLTEILNFTWANSVIGVTLVVSATDLGFDIFFW